ncbi:DUF4435 domain-containing protein [Sphingobium sp. B11D3D]|uniref:DUF4435 domain-containing protein n=1 Tax=Sphingobium sp. B11D3D TaxID=2940576 RepID=UPI0022251D52|nr:DUF4435 domain-containing protein [Sphingobium sp. B11D3D]MCW2370328.1 hypothetical protein [Sphingobium sp. B11D3D]
MKSISAHLKPKDFAAQIRMERQKHRGIFLLLEGANDAKRFKKFLHEPSCSVINCFGKANVRDTIELQQDVGNDDCIGFIDADFDRIDGKHADNEDILISNTHDFDTDVCYSDAMLRYLEEMGTAGKLCQGGGAKNCVADIAQCLKPLSCLRYVNQRDQLGYKLDRVDLEVFFNGHILDLNAMIDHVSQGRFSSDECKTSLRSRVEHFMGVDFDLWQLTNGHDLIAAIGIALRDRLGERRPPQTWRSEVERHLRLTFDVSDFRELGMLARIQVWETARPGKVVLRPGLA